MGADGDKIALALSGGGFRATLFHLGVVALLHERKKLDQVKYIGSVSGGSILAAHLVLNWDRYHADFDSAAGELIKFTQADIRGKIIRRTIFAWLTLIPRFLLPKRYRWTVGNLLQWLFRSQLFQAAELQDLRKSGREIFINCTSLTTGSACFFSKDSFNWYEKEESKTKAGEIVYAPKRVPLDQTPVWYAVAASSAFPPLFPPIEISSETLVCRKDDFKDVFRLTDGGVYDNLGINRLFELSKEAEFVLISDAEGDFDSEFDKDYAWPVSRNVRASDLLMTRVSSLQLDALESDEDKKFVRVGIKDVLPKINKDEKRLTFEQQRAIAKVRTDLDAFSAEEVSALILHGFNVAQTALIENGRLDGPFVEMVWPRFKEFPQSYPGLLKELVTSAKRRLRLLAWDWISIVTILLLVGFGWGAFEAGRWGYNIAEQNFRAAGALKVAIELADKISTLQGQLKPVRGPITTTTLQVCQGEFSDQCPVGAHWVDCGKSVRDFVAPMCDSFTSTRVSSRSGNRCGYSVDQIVCSFEVPNFSGLYSCEGKCSGQGHIFQSDRALRCTNERNETSVGTISGRRAFVGCWGLEASVSEDLKKIDWHNGTVWSRVSP
ncbi:patatin-like phospholipase family protein [Bradyrhizobium barranii subsp. apii]|uniref:patatin-like phospholipase family protein n=1 Tax=Bradyrhizobium barranii TaxID=2992140 RepID=UPI001AA14644|nr:patatin-like phospholipase family protein [Bradyrhizobium barranii]UPT96481.1 patatin-like phospholipase family protein [Bradyrhizobium barranii subsp. apii]